MDTTQKIKSRFPDLNFVKPLPVNRHPKYQQFGIKLSPNRHKLLPKGHLKEAGRRKILVDSVLEQDTPIPLRDGLKVYADIFRPQSSDQTKVPVAICWSPYGKASSGLTVDFLPYRLGIPKDRTSGYETFEGLDPADWCHRGYAVVNVDARGSQFSEGTYFFWGDQEAEDVYDTIEFLSKQHWCNGSVCMAGNSYLAKAQVSFASRMSHPALKALAPWEGFTDIYRQLFRRGGFAMNNLFAAQYQFGVAGEHEVEDMAAMVKSHPLFDDYWAGKYDEVANIDVPLYLLASFSNPFHIYGSFDTFRRARAKRKWLRVHSTFEWYEMYEHASNDDLQRFFDRYCKGIMNGWEHDTPPLRLSLIGCDGSLPNIVQRPETEFPLRRQQLKKFYLDGATKTLTTSAADSEVSVFHDGHSLNASSVSYTFHVCHLANNGRISSSNSPNIRKLRVTPRFAYGCLARRKMTWMLSSRSERLTSLACLWSASTSRLLHQRARCQIPACARPLAHRGFCEHRPCHLVMRQGPVRMDRKSSTGMIASKRYLREPRFH